MKIGSGVAWRGAAAIVLLIMAMTGLAACSGSKTGASSSVTAQPMSFEQVNASVQHYMACAIPAGRAKRLRETDYAMAAIRDAGFDALHRNAVEVAGDRVSRFEETYAPHGDEVGRAQGDLEAIVSATSIETVPEALRAKARAYEAYYQSLAVGGDCKVDEDVLKLINKG